MKFSRRSIAALLAACFATPPALAWCDDPSTLAGSVCKRLSDTWQQGQGELLLPFYTYHMPFAYSQDQIDDFEQNTWGLGYGRSRYDDEGNWHGLYAMGFRDSHGKFEPIIGYGYQWMWGEHNGLHGGLGYTVFVTARSDIANYFPIPGILPIASINYRRSALSMTYVPGGDGNGNILFFWARFGF